MVSSKAILTFIGNNVDSSASFIYKVCSRSTDYGASFTPIETQVDNENSNPSLWASIYVSPIHPQKV